MKYLITKNGITKVFPDEKSHSSMAAKRNIASAGYVALDGNGGIKTYGKSHSSGIKSKKEDKVKVALKLRELSRKNK